MKATIVTIGDEILIGQIVDTNSGYIAKALDKIGVQTTEMLSISDDKNHILDTFASLQDKVDLVIITGGLSSEGVGFFLVSDNNTISFLS